MIGGLGGRGWAIALLAACALRAAAVEEHVAFRATAHPAAGWQADGGQVYVTNRSLHLQAGRAGEVALAGPDLPAVARGVVSWKGMPVPAGSTGWLDLLLLSNPPSTVATWRAGAADAGSIRRFRWYGAMPAATGARFRPVWHWSASTGGVWEVGELLYSLPLYAEPVPVADRFTSAEGWTIRGDAARLTWDGAGLVLEFRQAGVMDLGRSVTRADRVNFALLQADELSGAEVVVTALSAADGVATNLLALGTAGLYAADLPVQARIDTVRIRVEGRSPEARVRFRELILDGPPP